MALAPKFDGQRFAPGSKSASIHTLELYLDYVCPFSAKMFKTVYNDVFPTVEKKYAGKIQFIFRQQIQPWHPSSTLTHEAALAVLRAAPDKFYPFSNALFQNQTEYFDVSVVNEPRNKTYGRLAKLAQSIGSNEKEIYGLLEVGDKPGEGGSLNIGNQVTDDLKLLVKAARLTGVHVSPTVLFNGIVEGSISSSFTKDQWDEWLEKNVV